MAGRLHQCDCVDCRTRGKVTKAWCGCVVALCTQETRQALVWNLWWKWLGSFVEAVWQLYACGFPGSGLPVASQHPRILEAQGGVGLGIPLPA